MSKYKVLVGCNFPPNDTRAEAGDVIDVSDDVGKALARIGAVKGHTSSKTSKAPNYTSEVPIQPQAETEG